MIPLTRWFLWTITAGVLLFGSGCSNSPKKHLERGSAYLAQGDYDRAEIEFRNALQKEPRNADAISGLAIVYFDQARVGTVYSFLNKAKELRPENVEIRRRMASLLMTAGKPKEAHADAIFVVEKQPSDEEGPVLLVQTATTPEEIEAAQQRLAALPPQLKETAPVLVANGLAKLRLGRVEEAEDYFRRAQSVAPEKAVTHLGLVALGQSQKNPELVREAFANAAKFAPVRSGIRVQYAHYLVQQGKVEEARAFLAELTAKAPDALPAQMMLAELLGRERRFEEAIAMLGKVLARDPINPEAIVLASRFRSALGKHERAITDLERVISIFPQSAQLHFQLGVTHASIGDYTKAIVSLTEALRLNPDMLPATVAMAEVHSRQGNYASASSLLRKVAEKNPNLVDVQLALANVYVKQRNLPEALALYDALFRANPRNGQLALLVGSVQLQMGRRAEARRYFELSRELAPSFFPALEQLAGLDLAEGKREAARERVTQAIAANPTSSPLHLLLARIYLAEGETGKAEATLREAIRLNPEDGAPYVTLARLYVGTKETEKAIANLDEAVSRRPKDAQALLMLAVIHDEQKNYEKARELYERVLGVNPNMLAALNNLAYLYSEHLGNMNRAFELAQKAREIAPSEPNSTDTLGWILYKRGQYAWALALLSESAEKLKTSAEVQYHLGMTQYMLGDEAGARRSLETSLDIASEFTGSEDARRALTILKIDPATATAAEIEQLSKAAAAKADPVALIRLGAWQSRQGNPDQAISSYEAALKASPSNRSAALQLIRLYEGQRQMDKALELAKATRKIAPGDAEVAHLLGRLAFETGDHVWAATLLQEAVQRAGTAPETLYDFARAVYSVGNITGAAEAYRNALESGLTGEKATLARQNIHIIALAENPAGLAEAPEIAKFVDDPNRSEVGILMLRGALLEQRGDFEAARTAYDQAVSQYPSFAPAKRRYAIASTQTKGDEQKAYDLGTRARESYPNDPELARSLGLLAFRLRNFSRAATFLEERTRAQPADAESTFYLGLARRELNELPGSRKALELALSLNLPTELAAEAQRVLRELK